MFHMFPNGRTGPRAPIPHGAYPGFWPGFSRFSEKGLCRPVKLWYNTPSETLKGGVPVETVAGDGNWKLTFRREPDHIVLLRAVTCDSRAVLPGELLGLPVTVLGDHALAPNAAPVPGEELWVTCGHQGSWDNRALEDLTLPPCLEEVGDYALYGCREMHTLRLHDRVERWGGGCLMNCRALRAVFLTRVGKTHGEALAFLCDELHEELDVTVYETDGGVTRLVFPDYVEAYEENCPAHHFDYTIYGGGHAYHHVFRDRQLSLRDYDGLWGKYLGEEHEPETALRLAWLRLRWPSGLSREAEERYWQYLKGRPREALLWQLSQKDIPGLRLLLDGLQPGPELLGAACEQARRDRDTEALALLLERRHQTEPGGFGKRFEL